MLQRIKANMTMKDVEAKGCHHPPHVDIANPDSSMVYYLHDNTEGDTIIFDKKYNANNPSDRQHEGLKELTRVSPKKVLWSYSIAIDSMLVQFRGKVNVDA